MKTRIALFALLSLSQTALASPPQDDPPKTESAFVELYVIDEDDEGVFKASVYLVLTEEEDAEKRAESGGRGYAIETITTDPDGFVQVPVPSGERRTLKVTKFRDAKPAEVEIEPLAPGEVREVEVTLITKPDLDVRAKVVDADTREPLAGVEVHLSERGGMRFGGRPKGLEVDDSPEAVTAADGTFELRVKSWQYGTVTFVAPGRSPLMGILAPRGAARPFDPPFAMRKAGALVGTVTRSEGDLPAGLTVAVDVRGYHLAHDDAGKRSGSYNDATFVARVDENGGYRLDDLPADVPLNLRVEESGGVVLREASERTLVPGEVTNADLVLGAGKRVHGIVLEADGPAAANIEVWLRRPRGRAGGIMTSYPKPDVKTRTGPDGVYEFTDVQPGKWEVGLAPSQEQRRMPAAKQYAPISQVVEVGADDVAADLVAHRGNFIHGTIETPSGEPFSGGGASVFAVCDSLWISNIDVRDGAFRAGPLVPGEWSVTASCWGRNAVERTYAGSAAVIAEPGDEPIVLRFQPGCGMTLHAVDPESGKTVDAIYSLYGTETPTYHGAGEPRETSEVGNLLPDTYTATMRTPDGRFGYRTIELAAGDLLEDEAIELGPGGAVQLKCVSTSKYVQVELYVDGHKVGYTSMASGAEQTLHGPVGRATLVFTEGGGAGDVEDARSVTHDVELVEGSTIRVDARID